MGPSTGSTIAVGKNLALIPIWGLTSGIFTTPVDEKLESCGKNTTESENITSPLLSLTSILGAYPCPVKKTLVPSKLIGLLTKIFKSSEPFKTMFASNFLGAPV